MLRSQHVPNKDPRRRPGSISVIDNIPTGIGNSSRDAIRTLVKLKGRARWLFVTFRGVDYIDLYCHKSASQAKKSQIIHEEAGTAIDSIYR